MQILCVYRERVVLHSDTCVVEQMQKECTRHNKNVQQIYDTSVLDTTKYTVV